MPKSKRHIDKDLIARIERCIAATGSNMTAFGKEAIKDHRLLADLKEGRELRRATREQVEDFLTKQERRAL